MNETNFIPNSLGENPFIIIPNDKIKPSNNVAEEERPKPFTYEEAISATGFGKFNIILLILIFPSTMSSIFVTTSMSFILSEIQCDLEVSLADKGLLNAITYVGMVCSAFLWGMIGDNFGRKIVLLYSMGFDTLFCLISAFSHTKIMLLTTKFLSGFVMNGPVTVVMTYVAEFHNTSFRPQIITILGIYYGIARILLPLIAWAILPSRSYTTIIEGIIELKSWQIYLVACCVPSLLSVFIFLYLPETPKFLMTQGRFDEAIELFRKIYVANTKHKPESLPFSELIDDTFEKKENTNDSDPKSKFAAVMDMIKSTKPLFLPPYLFKTTLMTSIFFGVLLGGNTLRLWLPELLSAMENYIQHHENSNNVTLCEMLDYSFINKPKVNATTCQLPDVTQDFYINNTVVPISTIFGFFIVSALVKRVGKKILTVCQYVLAAICVIANYWATNTITTVVLSSIFLTFFSICITTATGIAVELYPTNLRVLATSIFLLGGRLGGILGNLIFSVLLLSGCLPPFLFIGGFMFMCAILSAILPGTENKPLK